MDYNKIKMLLERYWEGETSLNEEQELKDYFNSSMVAEDLKQYKPLFVYFDEQKKLTSQQSFEHLKVVKTKQFSLYRLSAVAASVLVVLSTGFYYYNNNTTTINSNENPLLIADTYKNPDEAFEEAKAALMLISKKMNKGMDKGKESIKKVKD